VASSNVINTSVVPVESTVRPYWDDFDEEKNFYRILYRPGYAVQSRELIQMQTMSQVQLERLGRHIFKNGSIVQGGQLSYDTATALNLATQYAATDIEVSNFIGNEIVFASGNNDVRAQVISGENASGTEPPTLMIKYLSGKEFGPSSVIKVSGANTFANVAISGISSNGTVASISDGIFFLNGFFVRNGRQTITVSKYNTIANTKVGLQYTDAIIDEESDNSLLDPALEASNFDAPGAARYKIDLELTTRSLDSTDLSKFVELSRLELGDQTKSIRIPIYSELEETFARRTYDESGNYTVRPFKLDLKEDSANSANLIAKLDSGKAYVYGYEFETIAPEVLYLPRTREYANTNNYDISTAYGNYVTVNTIRGIPDISTMAVMNLHSVNVQSIVRTSAATYNSTRMGTTRVRSMLYNTATNTADGLLHNLNYYIFDTQLISLTGLAGPLGNTTNSINLLGTAVASANDNAYNGATIRITGGTSSGDLKTIVAYNGATKMANVDSAWSSSIDATSTWSIDFSTKEIESLDSASANANISLSSKDNGTTTGNTAISEQGFDSLVFPFPASYIRHNPTVNNYQYKKTFAAVFAANSAAITAASDEAFVGTGSLSDSIKLTNYLVIITNPLTSGLTNGQVLSMTEAAGRSISVAGQVATFTVNVFSGAFNATIIASCDINTGQYTNPKTKTLVSANTWSISSSASNGSFISANGANATLYLNQGQTIIQNPNRRPSVLDSLYISDVTKVNAIFDLAGATVTAGTLLSGYTNVSNRFTYDNGQKDTHYDHASIILKPGVAAPKGPLVVCVDYYNHVQGAADSFAGYFSVDSYPSSSTTEGYSIIPWYTTEDGVPIRLSDAIDFRPKRQNAANTSPGYTMQGIRIPTPNEEYSVSFAAYLGRKDIIALSKDKSFRYLQGISGYNPTYPSTPDDVMVLYKLDLPPFTAYAANVTITYIENKRYTMRDIGKLEQRIKNLEYYQTLSILEKSATDVTIRDSNGLERTKYGIIADTFQGHQIGDITNSDYRCSIDFTRGGLRPFFKQDATALAYVAGDSNSARHGSTATLAYTEEEFVTVAVASKTENVQPFLIAKFIGQLNLFPDNDIWQDTTQRPDVVVNLSGANDAWDALATEINSEIFGTEWGSWENHWTGTSKDSNTVGRGKNGDPSKDGNTRHGTIKTTTITDTGFAERTGTQTTLNFDTITESLGDRVVDVSIVPFIRPRAVIFRADNMRPNRTVFAYFDDESIDQYIYRPNEIVTDNTNKFIDSYGRYERVSTIAGANTATLLISRPNLANTQQRVLQVVSSNGAFVVGQTITGASSGNTAVIMSVDHFSGNTVSATASQITLKSEASTVNDYYTGNTIVIVAGTNKGVATGYAITGYNGTTKVANVSPSFAITPTSNSIYSIHKPTSVDGPFKTNDDGTFGGILYIPSDDTMKFRTGQRILRIIDNNTNDLDNASTRVDGKYVAQGLMQSKEELSVSVTVPVLTVTDIRETVPITNVTTKVKTTVYKDPLAQTFYVEESDYPGGVFLSSVDLFFKLKDTSLPVWVEIRPVVNGFPHSSLSLPYSRKTVNAESVNISNLPDTTASNTATTFAFDNPVYLEAGKEYALVVQTNSLNYEVFVSELGKKQIGSDSIISEQPYLGSLFKSQNASTWTPFQFEDMMFVLKKCVFTTTPSNIYFSNETLTVNQSMDWMHVQGNNLLLSNTKIDFAFKAKSIASEVLDTAYAPFNINSDYAHDARKVITVSGTESFNLKCTLSTSNPDITPWVDLTRYNIITIENIINNANLSNTTIVITNDGSGYGLASTLNVSIVTADSVSPANAYIGTVTTGNIATIIVDAPGSGYLGSANVQIYGANTTPASAVMSSELDAKGGTILSKYITRKVILNEGYDAGDLRVFITASKPIGTDLVLYYKVRSTNDPTKFENRPYVKMVQATATNRYSSYDGEMLEYEFRPSNSTNAITYNNGSTTFDTFNEFAIKIGMISTSTITVPIVKDFRCIALPSSS